MLKVGSNVISRGCKERVRRGDNKRLRHAMTRGVANVRPVGDKRERREVGDEI